MAGEGNVMSDPQFFREMESNKKAWESLRDRVRREYAGQFVALAFGRIVASGAQVDQVTAAVQHLDPKPAHYEVFPAEAEPMFDVVYSVSSEYLPE
jgi:hypothetical protein